MVERIGQLERHGVKSYDSLVNWSFASTGAEVIDDYLFGTPSPGELVFEDNFTGSALNTSNWTVVTGSGSVIDGGEEYYAENKVGVSNGNLSLGLSTGTVTNFINHVSIDVPANGTTTHSFNSYSGTVVAGSAFRPTPGSLLVLVVADYVPTISTPTGWTLGASIGGQAWTNVYYKIATGSDDVTVTHNFSGYPMMADYYEFTAGTTWVNAVTAGSVANGGAGPTLSGLTGNNWVAAVATEGITTSNGSNTFTWNNGTEAVDYNSVGASVTYSYSLSYRANYGSATASSVATSTSVTSHDQVIFAVKPPTSTETVLGGRVYSKYKINAHYGRIEARIQLPAGGQGLWPAFWLMGDESAKGLWPRNGEIDIMESINDMSRVYGSVHGPTVAAPGTQWSNETYYVPTASPITGFHTYAIEWGPDVIHWYFDNIKYKTLKVSDVDTTTNAWPFNDTFAYLILNVAYGGVMAGSSNGTAVLPQSMLVDYVRVYERDAYALNNSKTTGLKTRFTDAREINVDGTIATISGGTLNVTPTSSYYNGNTQRRFDLTDSSIFYSIAQLPNVGTGTISAFMKIDHIYLNGSIKAIEYGWNGSLYSHETVAAGSDTFATYNATTMRFLRVRHQSSNNTLYWDYSPDAVIWTNFRSQVISPYTDLTNVDVLFLAGYYGTEPSPGVAKFDNVNYGAPISELSDDFNNGTVDSNWSIVAAGVTESGGSMRLTQTTANVQPEVRTANYYGLEDGNVIVNISDWKTGLASGGYTEARFDTLFPETSMYVRYNQSGNFDVSAGGVTSTSIAAWSTNFAYIRFANAAGIATIDCSPDGTTWTNLVTVDQTNTYLQNMFLGRLDFKSASTATAATSAPFIIDGVNVAGVSVTPISASDTGAITIAEVQTSALSLSRTDGNGLAIGETQTSNSTLSTTDGNGLVISESRTQAVTLSAVDGNGLVITENSGVTNNQPANESVSVSVAETNTILVTVATTDTGSVSVAETSAPAVSVATTDGNGLAIAEVQTSALSLSRTDGNGLAIAETDSTFSIGSTVDGNALVVTESRNVDTNQPANDTTAAGITETNTILVSVNVVDGGAVSVAEVSTPTLSVSTSDTGSIAIAETSTPAVSLTATESNSLSIAETNTGYITTSAVDGNALVISEIRNIDSGVPATEPVAVSVSETSSVFITSSASESNSLTIAETSGIFNAVNAVDGNGLVSTEVTSGAITFASTDGNALVSTESTSGQNTVSATDTTAVSVLDMSNNASSSPGIDSASIAITETTDLFKTMSAVDTTAVSVADVSNATLSMPVSTTDTTAVSVAETTSSFITLTTNDGASVSVSEVSGIAASAPAAESITVGADDQSNVIVFQSRPDTSAVSVAETSAVASTTTSTDTTAISIAEANALTNAFGSTESGALSVVETNSFFVAKSTSDTGAISVVDVSATDKISTSVDGGSLAIDELSNNAVSAPGTDTIAVAIVEQTTTVSAGSTTDDNSLAASDAGLVDIDGTPDDGTGVAVGESVQIFVTQATTDTGSIAVAENAGIDNNAPSNESTGVATSEQATVFVIIVSGDGGAVSVSEQAATFVTLASSDAAGVSGAETDSSDETRDASEFNSLTADETTQFAINRTISTTESNSLAVSETAGTFFVAPGQDTTAISVSEQASIVTSGGMDIGGTESTAFVLSEGVSIMVSITATELSSIAETETNTGSHTMSALEFEAVSVAESRTQTGYQSRVDSSGLATNETNSIYLTGAAYGDDLTMVVGEQAFVQPLGAGAEYPAIAISETSSIVVGGAISKSAVDNGSLAIVEQVNPMVVFLSRGDTVGLAEAESNSFGTITFTAGDGGSVGTIETIIKPTEASDELRLFLEELGTVLSTEFFSTMEAGDSLTLYVSEYSKVWIIGGEHVPTQFASNIETAIINSTGGRNGNTLETRESGNNRSESTSGRNIRVE